MLLYRFMATLRESHLAKLQGSILCDPRKVGLVAEDLGDAQRIQGCLQVIGSRDGQFGEV